MIVFVIVVFFWDDFIGIIFQMDNTTNTKFRNTVLNQKSSFLNYFFICINS